MGLLVGQDDGVYGIVHFTTRFAHFKFSLFNETRSTPELEVGCLSKSDGIIEKWDLDGITST
jgi:hypothetical protein